MVSARFSDLIRRWGTRISFSLVDQTLFSGANFLLNILLARWLLPETYGAFVVAFAVFLFLAGFHSALIIEPLSVLGPSRYATQSRRYFSHLLRIHGGLTIGLSLVLCIGAFAFLQANPDLAYAFWGVALALPLTLFFWLLRRVCYIEANVAIATKGSVLYALLLLGGLGLLGVKEWVSPVNAYLVMGASGLGAGLFLHLMLRSTWRDQPSGGPALPLRGVLKEHWRYGRWITGATMANSLSSIVFIPLIATMLGLAQAGAFRAIQNLVAPLMQVITALGVLLLPWMAKQHAENGMAALKRTVRKATLLNTGTVVCFGLVLVFFSEEIITFLYGDAYYTELRWLLVYFVGALLLLALSQPLALALRAMEKPSAILWSKLGVAVCFVLIGLPLVLKAGLVGAGWSLVLVALAETVVLVYCMKKNVLRYALPKQDSATVA